MTIADDNQLLSWAEHEDLGRVDGDFCIPERGELPGEQTQDFSCKRGLAEWSNVPATHEAPYVHPDEEDSVGPPYWGIRHIGGGVRRHSDLGNFACSSTCQIDCGG